jgi:hypothetical protein
MEALNAKPDDAMGCDSISDRDEADTTGIVVLQRVVERKSVHSLISVGAQKVSLVNCFTKSANSPDLENLVAPRLLCGPKQLVHMGRSVRIRP